MNSDRAEVDALILSKWRPIKTITRYAAAERLLQKRSTNLEAYQYLRDRAREELRKMI